MEGAPEAGAGYDVPGVAYVILRRELVPNGRSALADQVLTHCPIIVVQVVWVRALLRKFTLPFLMGQVRRSPRLPTIRTTATLTVLYLLGLGVLTVRILTLESPMNITACKPHCPVKLVTKLR